jgi:hypothetical protein
VIHYTLRQLAARHRFFLPVPVVLPTDILFCLTQKRCRWEDNIKMDLQETRREGGGGIRVDWIDMFPDRYQ